MFFKPVFCLTVLIGLGAGAFSPAVQAQQERPVLQSLLKTLIESQLQKQAAPPANGPNLRPAQPQYRGPVYGRNPAQLPARAPIGARPVELVNAQRYLDESITRCDTMLASLQAHQAKSPALRPLLADGLGIRADLDVARQLAARSLSVDPIVQRVAAIDQDWRLLNHRLASVRGIDKGCRKAIERFDKAETQLREALNITPQFNRIELLQLSASLSAGVEHLVQDLQYEMQGQAGQAKIVRQGQQLYSQIAQATPVVQRGSYEQIVRTFKNGQRDWRKFSSKVRPYATPRIQQDMQRIQETGAQIADLLWLPVELDRDYLIETLAAMQHDVDGMLGQVSLSQLMDAESPGAILGMVRDFRREGQTLAAQLSSGQSVQDLLWQYQLFARKWEALDVAMEPFATPQLRQYDQSVHRSMDALASAIGQGPTINRQTLIEIGRDLDQLTAQLQYETAHHITPNRYPPIAGVAAHLSDELHEHAHHLNEHVIMTSPRKLNIGQFAGPAVQHWSEFKQLMPQIRPADLRHFSELRSQIEPLMVKLQVAYEN